MMNTINDIYNFEMMQVCSCGRQKAVYFCKYQDCPNHRTQPYYCPLCSDDEEEKHMHKEAKIAREVQLIKNKWN